VGLSTTISPKVKHTESRLEEALPTRLSPLHQRNSALLAKPRRGATAVLFADLAAEQALGIGVGDVACLIGGQVFCIIWDGTKSLVMHFALLLRPNRVIFGSGGCWYTIWQST
jgi:hypothetical protein